MNSKSKHDSILNFDVSSAVSDLEMLEVGLPYLEEQFARGSGKAGFILSILHSEGLVAEISVKDFLRSVKADEVGIMRRAFPLLHEEALSGDGEAMHFLAQYYQCGMPPIRESSMEMFQFWVNKARLAGFVRTQY